MLPTQGNPKLTLVLFFFIILTSWSNIITSLKASRIPLPFFETWPPSLNLEITSSYTTAVGYMLQIIFKWMLLKKHLPQFLPKTGSFTMSQTFLVHQSNFTCVFPTESNDFFPSGGLAIRCWTSLTGDYVSSLILSDTSILLNRREQRPLLPSMALNRHPQKL